MCVCVCVCVCVCNVSYMYMSKRPSPCTVDFCVLYSPPASIYIMYLVIFIIKSALYGG